MEYGDLNPVHKFLVAAHPTWELDSIVTGHEWNCLLTLHNRIDLLMA